MVGFGDGVDGMSCGGASGLGMGRSLCHPGTNLGLVMEDTWYFLDFMLQAGVGCHIFCLML